MLNLRPWQEQAVTKAIKWLTVDRTDKHFLINAAPGAGKTIAASVIADTLMKQGEIDRVIVIAPRSEVVNQWADVFKTVTGRYMSKVTGSDGNIDSLGVDLCATWAALQGLFDPLRDVCARNKTLVICDEHHHAAVTAAWGENTESALAEAKFALILTGTPIRSDGAQSVWLAYDDNGTISHPEAGTYTLSYGDAVDLAYCRPTTFHRHEGKFTVQIDNNDSVCISGHQEAELSNKLAKLPGLQKAMDFYRLAKTPQYEADDKTPTMESYQASMLEYASLKLDQTRERMPEAGGLVIAPNIIMAEYMAKLIERIEGEAPLIVHSDNPNSDSRIKAFKNTDKRWIVSVAMISEGVDIPRLRVLVYLPNALTELAFRQAIGRVVRTQGHNDDTSAYVVMPSIDIFDNFARKVEKEMSPAARNMNRGSTTKKCPRCHNECERSALECDECGYEFPQPDKSNLKPCPTCETLNPASATTCLTCGESFGVDFILSLDEALRDGAIVSGMDIDEVDVRVGEEIADDLRQKVISSGDELLIQMINRLPDAAYGRFAVMCAETLEGASTEK